jgi:hypothetical protein
MAEIAARLVAAERERDALKVEVERLKDALAQWDPVFAIRQSLPTDEEAAALLKIVTSRYPHMREHGVMTPISRNISSKLNP